MTTEQITLLIGAVVAFLQVLTVAIGIWNKNHIAATREEQKRVAQALSGVQADGVELRRFLISKGYGPTPTPSQPYKLDIP